MHLLHASRAYCEFCKMNSIIQVVVCTSALALGVKIAHVKQVVHWEKVASGSTFWQEVGRCGPGGSQCTYCSTALSKFCEDVELSKAFDDQSLSDPMSTLSPSNGVSIIVKYGNTPDHLYLHVLNYIPNWRAELALQ